MRKHKQPSIQHVHSVAEERFNQEVSISVIIPTLDEEEKIRYLLAQLCELEPGLEIIVADGGSTDRTVQQARDRAYVVVCERGRARQMNSGARLARGEVLWFLHADSVPHPDSLKAIRRAVLEDGVVGGAFEYAMDGNRVVYRVSEFFSNRKNRLFKLFYGDMGIFVRRDVFWQLGGFAEMPLMEDLDFCLRLRQAGPVCILPQRIMTSSRRWEIEGPVRTIVRNWLLQIAWKLGASPETLARWYHFPQNGKRQVEAREYAEEMQQ
ncbi:MAG: glycosyltransferase [Calditrichaeota bacterium]|nr:MAG: glycosyltransferase [Calditrichota bacterium]